MLLGILRSVVLTRGRPVVPKPAISVDGDELPELYSPRSVEVEVETLSERSSFFSIPLKLVPSILT